jgi:hypothetical protein
VLEQLPGRRLVQFDDSVFLRVYENASARWRRDGMPSSPKP